MILEVNKHNWKNGGFSLELTLQTADFNRTTLWLYPTKLSFKFDSEHLVRWAMRFLEGRVEPQWEEDGESYTQTWGPLSVRSYWYGGGDHVRLCLFGRQIADMI